MIPNFINPSLFIDAYKISHYQQYPTGTQRIVSNLTPRGSRIPGIDHLVFFGLQYFIKEYLQNKWTNDFFKNPDAIDEYYEVIKSVIGVDVPIPHHLYDLHSLGYLPICIKALPEGTKVPMRIPVLAIYNTHPKFYWLVNFLETQLSCIIWKMSTSATIANRYREIFDTYAKITGSPMDFVPWQGHDFSARGMSGSEDMMMSAAGHLTSFTGSDSIAAIPFLKEYYAATGLICGSVAALEHAVVCANGTDEYSTLKRLLTEVHPTGILSYVSDTWDFWKLITVTVSSLKDIIMKRNGKLVIRPDSGDPVEILTGNPKSDMESVRKGLIEVLWDIFGGTVNEQGYKVLDSHIGTIYGDSITLDRQSQILDRLHAKGFASSNVVLGIGSYTYQYVTRDTFGIAVKATHAIINGTPVDLYKAPKTDSGIKNSAKGLVAVYQQDKNLVLKDQISEQEFHSSDNLLTTVYENGNLLKVHTLDEIRNRLRT